jgi:hypothetical protein
VPLDLLRRVLDKRADGALGLQFPAVGSATVLTGEPLRALQEKMLASAPQDPKEYSFSEPDKSPLILRGCRNWAR